MRRGRLRALLRKEFVQFFRDYAMVVLVLYIFLEIALCAWALTLDVRGVPIAVYDLDRSPASRTVIERLARSESFQLEDVLTSNQAVAEHLDRGLARLVVIIPPDFARDLAQGRTAKVQLVTDGSDSYTATLATAYSTEVIQGYAGEVLAGRLGLPASQLALLPQVRTESRVWYDPALNFTHFNALVMVALAIPFVAILVTAGATVREKEAGTLEQLMVTPIRPWEFMLAKIIPIAVLSLVGLGSSVAIATWGFGAPLRGNLALFFAISVLAFFASAGLGVAIATVSRNLQQALLLGFFVLFPLAFLSGVLTPTNNMPLVLQYLSLLNPVRYFVTITIGIFMKGVGLETLWPQVASLAVLGAAIFALSLFRWRRRLV
jgi:ABC-2 type transport system permease protein